MRFNVTVLGGSGMVGNMMTQVLEQDENIKVYAPARKEFDLEMVTPKELRELMEKMDYCINCIGVTKTELKNSYLNEKRALLLNALLPGVLAIQGELADCSVINVGSDCVFSGKERNKTEEIIPDPQDLYGRTKWAGEWLGFENFLTLRCSMVGPEVRFHARGLLEWLVRLPKGAKVPGWANYWWNGITTLHFAKIVRGIITGRAECYPEGIQNIVPYNVITKGELLNDIRLLWNRLDLQIEEFYFEEKIDRSLQTCYSEINLELWRGAGYSEPLTVFEMLRELKAWPKYVLQAAQDISVPN